MASNKKDGQTGLTSRAPNEPAEKILDELDLDKKPIKFATSVPGELVDDAHDKDYLELTLRHGKHSELVQKILRQRIEQRAKEFPRWPGDLSGGVRAIWIESRFWYDRERMLPDFDADWRSYRAKYLHSLELDPREPVHVPEYEKALINPIRRFYMRGGDFLEDNFIRPFTKTKYESTVYRFFIVRCAMAYVGAIGIYYYMRYQCRKWDRTIGPEIFKSRPIMYPNDPRFPFKDYKTEPSHHDNHGFSNRTIFRDLRDYEDKTVVL